MIGCYLNWCHGLYIVDYVTLSTLNSEVTRRFPKPLSSNASVSVQHIFLVHRLSLKDDLDKLNFFTSLTLRRTRDSSLAPASSAPHLHYLLPQSSSHPREYNLNTIAMTKFADNVCCSIRRLYLYISTLSITTFTPPAPNDNAFPPHYPYRSIRYNARSRSSPMQNYCSNVKFTKGPSSLFRSQRR